MQSYNTVDEYLANFSGDTRQKLNTLRKTIKDLVPEAKEKIAYGIPTFTLNGNLVHFAGYKNHIGLYPGSAPIEIFRVKLTKYKTAKGTIQLPLDKPLPLDLIRDIVKVSVERNLQKRKSSHV